jgi:hypothetical protein
VSLTRELRALQHRAQADGRKAYRTRALDPSLKFTGAQWQARAWELSPRSLPWPSFFVYYPIFFKEGWHNERTKNAPRKAVKAARSARTQAPAGSVSHSSIVAAEQECFRFDALGEDKK